jgi:hypothetical protein
VTRVAVFLLWVVASTGLASLTYTLGYHDGERSMLRLFAAVAVTP